MRSAGVPLTNRSGYLERMAKPLQEKLTIAPYLPRAGSVLDVGCADGTVTCALGALFPNVHFLGIDLDAGFVQLAKQRAKTEGLTNVEFKQTYLRSVLEESARFDAVIFCSVLHEFYSYGQGRSSVVKALADAAELIPPEGAIVIRDMVLRDATKEMGVSKDLQNRVAQGVSAQVLTDFRNTFGEIDTLYKLNHLLLKYWYVDNWEREGPECYVPVTLEEYMQLFTLLGMSVNVAEERTLPYLESKWREDFRLTGSELGALRSTTVLVATRLPVA